MPVRILLTGRMHGPDVGSILHVVNEAPAHSTFSESSGIVTIAERLDRLKQALASMKVESTAEVAA